jgi:hypothetical protein
VATTKAIAAVTIAIRRLLEPALKPDFPTVQVKPYQAADFQRAETTTVLSLYLYRVAANTNRRNLPPRQESDGRRFRPALPLDLFYLLSAWGSSVEEQHLLLGQTLRILEDTSMLSAGLLNDGDRGFYARTFRAQEAVELVYDPLSLTDMVSLWDLLKPGVQPSCTYVARAIAIESEIELFIGDPVVERQFDYMKPLAETGTKGRPQ